MLTSLSSYSQVNTISPFSRVGIGDVQSSFFSQNFAMGGLNIGLQGPNNINPFNPASYSRLGWTSFEAAVITNNIWLESANQSQSGNVTNFSHLALGFPIAPWWGMSFAIMPVSHVGYDYRTSNSHLAVDSSIVNYNNEFLGSGGINKVLLGHGFSVRRTFFFGFNFAYQFGDIEYQETLNFTDNNDFLNSANLERIEAGDIYWDFGAQYRTNVGGKWRLDLGFVFTPLQAMSSKRNNFEFTYSNQTSNPRIIDTVSYSENASFDIILPPKYGLGFVMNKGDDLKIGLDLEYTLWSQSNYNTYGGLDDVYTLRTGVEIHDKEDRFILRFGGRYGNMPLVLNDSPSDEKAITAGVAFPFRSKDKLSFTVLNIGIEAGQRGKLEDQWLQESYIKVNVGLTLNNKWFIKRVYD